MFPFYAPLKTRQNQRVSSVFRLYEMGTLRAVESHSSDVLVIYLCIQAFYIARTFAGLP